MIKFNFVKLKPSRSDIALVSFNNTDNLLVLLLPDKQKEIQIGVGAKENFNLRKFILLARKIIFFAKANKIKKLALDFNSFNFFGLNISTDDLSEALVREFEMANFEFIKYKAYPKDGWNFIETVFLYGNASEKIKNAFRKGQIIGNAVNNARAFANTPGSEMTPTFLAQAARKAIRGTKIKIKVLDETQMKKLKMGGILGVAAGSKEKPKFIIMDWHGAHIQKEKPIVLIGKGITFDSGGLNLKPLDAISDMHMDMSGGAAVIHSVILAAKLGIKKRIIGLVPAVENMPSGSSFRPGDILKTMSGKTIEVLNTDAEGRIILADALTYAKQYEPKLVVDVATLTGAAMSALGQRASAIFSKDEKLIKFIQELGEQSGDYVWPLPLWDEYEEEIKGTFGDVANISKSKYGGAITAAVFLEQFAKDLTWAHIDIAPRMTAVEGEYLAKGATGVPVRLLIKLLELI